jgi:hypothetical protein
MNNRFKTVLLSAYCLFAVITGGCPFTKSENPVLPIGPTVKADLLVYFKRDLSQGQINDFINNVISIPDREGGGYDLPAGVRTRLRLRPVEGHEGIAITFFPNATKEQREELLRSIKTSPLVFRVLENTIPDNVKSLR